MLIISKGNFMNYFIEVHFFNPCSKEMDWCIVGTGNTEVIGEESAMLFSSMEEAKKWTLSKEAKDWLPCSFEIKKSIY